MWPKQPPTWQSSPASEASRPTMVRPSKPPGPDWRCRAIRALSYGALIILLTSPFWLVLFLKPHEVGGKRSICTNNLKQLGIALIMYTEDNDNGFPPKLNWSDATYPYLKSRGVYHCPEAPDDHSGYAYNASLNQISIKKLTNPARVVAFFDSRGSGWDISGGPRIADPRHHGGLTLGYADGHVKWVSAGDIGPLWWFPYVP